MFNINHNIFWFSIFLKILYRIKRILKYPWIQIVADWSCTVLVHNRTFCKISHIIGFKYSLLLSYLWFRPLFRNSSLCLHWLLFNNLLRCNAKHTFDCYIGSHRNNNNIGLRYYRLIMIIDWSINPSINRVVFFGIIGNIWIVFYNIIFINTQGWGKTTSLQKFWFLKF